MKNCIMLEAMPVCENWHSFSKEGSQFTMKLDYRKHKENYAFSKIEWEPKIGLPNIVTWLDYKGSLKELMESYFK